jgi:CheY-like chemotaxis protein
MQGYSVTEAASVADAVTGLAQHPDWVLLDLMLPDGCGSAVLKKVHADRLTTRVCVVTGCALSKLEEVRRLGPDHVLIKPLDVSQLMGVLAS